MDFDETNTQQVIIRGKTVEKLDREKYMIKTDVKEMGWTDSMIKKLLPEPIEKRNHLHPGGPTIKLWEKKIVLELMQTEEWNHLSQIAKRRSEAQLERWRKAQERLWEEIEENQIRVKEKISEFISNIYVERLSIQEVYELSLSEKKDWVNSRSRDYFDGLEACGETRERWAVNYIRHYLTNYDYYAEQTFKWKLEKEIYKGLKIAVLDKISEVYPEFKEECIQQKRKLEGKDAY